MPSPTSPVMVTAGCCETRDCWRRQPWSSSSPRWPKIFTLRGNWEQATRWMLTWWHCCCRPTPWSCWLTPCRWPSCPATCASGNRTAWPRPKGWPAACWQSALACCWPRPPHSCWSPPSCCRSRDWASTLQNWRSLARSSIRWPASSWPAGCPPSLPPCSKPMNDSQPRRSRRWPFPWERWRSMGCFKTATECTRWPPARWPVSRAKP